MITPEEAVANVEQRVRELRSKYGCVNKETDGLLVNDRADQIHCLFEGLCPTCGSGVALIRVSGVSKFLREMVFMGDHEICTWESTSEFSDDGGVEFKCKNDHEYYIGYSFSSGDWH